MITLEFVTNFVMENLSNVSVSKNGTHFHARCILCGDSKINLNKKRFHMEYNNGQPIYHCFNCDTSGSFLQLYSKIKNISINDAKKELYSFNANHLIQILSSKKKEKILKEIKYDNFNYIINDCIDINTKDDGIIFKEHKKKLKKFIKDRKIPDSYKIFIAYKGDYKGRIILPIYDGDDIIYFQARSLSSDDDGNKYKNPTLQKGYVILNKNVFNKNKNIIVTEGIIDALQIGNQGTSCLGASITDDFIKELFNYTTKDVILALDNDTRGIKETYKYVKNGKYAHNIKYFIFPDKYEYKDFGELTKECDINLYDFVTENSYSKFQALLKLKVEDVNKNENNKNRSRLY